jgi:hypothetical protein
MICTAYRIVLVSEIKVKKIGQTCGKYSGYRNKDGSWEQINNKGGDWIYLAQDRGSETLCTTGEFLQKLRNCWLLLVDILFFVWVFT